MNAKLPLVFIALFVLISAGVYLVHRSYPAYDFIALLAANAIMLLLSLGAWAMLRKNVAERPQAFVRGVYGATMMRLFVCLVGILSYALLNRPNLHKPTLFVMFGIYMAYTIIETVAFSRTAKKVS